LVWLEIIFHYYSLHTEELSGEDSPPLNALSVLDEFYYETTVCQSVTVISVVNIS
jgi:hypothetical protein